MIPAAIVARNTYAIPESLAFEAAAPLEPLACVVHGVAESGIGLGDLVVVHGAGPIGQMFIVLAQLRGATVLAADTSAGRLQQALDAGCAGVIDLTGLDTPAERAERVRAATPSGRGADVSIECAGLPEVWEQAWQSLRPGGTAVMFGGPKPGSTFSIDAVAMHYKEYKVLGVYHHAPRYVQTAVRLLSEGQFDGLTLCSEVRPLESLVDCLEDMSRGVGSKYILQP